MLRAAGAADLCKSGADPSPLASGIERPCDVVAKIINMQASSANQLRWLESTDKRKNRKIPRNYSERLPLKQYAKKG